MTRAINTRTHQSGPWRETLAESTLDIHVGGGREDGWRIEDQSGDRVMERDQALVNEYRAGRVTLDASRQRIMAGL